MQGTLLLLFAGAFVLSVLLTAWIRRSALAWSLLDIPNTRSSHRVPTPRGGGLAIALSWCAVLIALMAMNVLEGWVGLALIGGGGSIALIGWLDDRFHLSPVVRAVVHLVASGWAVWCVGGLPSMNLGLGPWPLGWLGAWGAVVGISWLANVYNFMDGIDGLAGGEAVSVSLVAGGLMAAAGAWGLASAAWGLAAASAGFLVFNWPPAKIFMGDVGSGLLGYGFGVLAVASERMGALPLGVWMILLGVFVVDATATLIRRVIGGERWYEAHRSHAYQRAVEAGYSHRQVTVSVLALNGVLALVAVGVWAVPSWLLGGLVAVVGSLIIGWSILSLHVFVKPCTD